MATPLLLGGASAVADTVGVQSRPLRVTSVTTSDDGRNKGGGGLVTRFRGMPAEFEAGGDWQVFNLVLENITEEELTDFTLDIQLITFHPGESLQTSHVSVQAKHDDHWEDLELWDMGGQDVDVILPVDGMKLAPGETVIPLRMKFAGDAPSVRFHIGPQADEEHAEEANEDYWESAWITRPAHPEPEPSLEPEPSEDPGPEPSTQIPAPSPDPGTSGGMATSGGGTGPMPGGIGGSPGGASAASGGAGQGGWTAPATSAASAPGGGLARTGSDAVTSWALGAGGALVLLGAGLAVAGRRARKRKRS
ncbi:hypothetical protein [Streptomyces sp. YIM 132580]|uniref:hypothetical protein n=1 Tax=Streptomyces sp. YIM 132580 TaxID=2691958 RepID=UPI00136E5CC6|nr:hypothetical protein [Streptomyces sp. YIM 132580]MXG30480.1 hypothetical protein [Streptomyces sp. YIM 132580]